MPQMSPMMWVLFPFFVFLILIVMMSLVVVNEDTGVMDESGSFVSKMKVKW